MQATPGLPKPSDTSRSTGRMCHDRPPNIVFDVTGGPVGGTRRDVPFCADAWSAAAVVLARCSVLCRRRAIVDLVCADLRRRYQSLRSPAMALCAGEAHSATLLAGESSMRPEQHEWG